MSSPANWTCPRTAPYDPILSIPEEVRHIDPDWAKCVGGIDGTYDPPIALTPADSIAKPTVPGGIPDPSSDAVPASSPKPTLAPVTTTAPSNKPPATSSPADQPAPKPSPSDNADGTSQVISENDPPAASATQPARESAQQSRPSEDHPSSDSAVTSAGNNPSAAQSSGADPPPNSPTNPKPAESGNETPEPFTGNDPASSTNALSVLSEAQSSPDGSALPATKPTSNPSPSPDGPNDDEASDPDSPTDSPDKPQGAKSPTVASLAGGGSATIYQAESSIVVAQDGLSAGAAQGSDVTIGTHVFSAASEGNVVVVDSFATHSVPPPVNQRPSDATISADGRVVSAVREGSAVIVADATHAFTAQAGETITIGSETVKINTDGSGLEVGSSSIAIPNKLDAEPHEPVAVWSSGSSTFTAIAQASSVVLLGPDTTATLAAGAAATFAGEVFSVPTSGSVVFHGDKTATFGAPDVSGAITIEHEGHELIASATDGSIVIQQGSSTVTLAPEQQTMVDGITLSAARSGEAVVVNGNETVSLQTTGNSTVATSLSATSRTESGADTTGDVEEATGNAPASETNVAASGAGKTLGSTMGLSLCFFAVLCLL